MSGLSDSINLEIFQNPGDLEISIERDDVGKKWAFSISRGPGGSSKKLINSGYIFDDTIEAIDGFTVTINRTLIGGRSKPPSEEVPEPKVLNQKLIDQISDELFIYVVAKTWEMLTPTK